jgi:hypothetical protein
MRASGALDQRLLAHVQPTIRLKSGPARFYEIVEPPSKAIVEELATPGEARVECALPDGSRCVRWTLGTGKFQFLQEEKNADGALLLWRDDSSVDGAFEAHIVECKKTVDQTKWGEVLEQMRWTLARLLAISGTLGVPLTGARFYTAYRFDKLSSDSSRNPLLPRIPIGGRSRPGDELSRARRLQLDWESDDVAMDGFEGRFQHRKVKLDEASGAGAVDLGEGSLSARGG